MDYIHTRIDHPLDLRKKVLESAIDVTDIMKYLDEMGRISEDSGIFRKELKGFMLKLTAETNTLLKVLPPLPQEFVQKDVEKEIQKPKILERAAADKPRYSEYMGERDRLERELENIRRRMSSIRV